MDALGGWDTTVTFCLLEAGYFSSRNSWHLARIGVWGQGSGVEQGLVWVQKAFS